MRPETINPNPRPAPAWKTGRGLLLLLLLLFAPRAAAQGEPPRVGPVEFFGYAKVDLERVRAALPLREGDALRREDTLEAIERVGRAVTEATGRAPTDVAFTCCDGRGGTIIFIGLGGRPVRYQPAPRGKARLPADAFGLYEEFSRATQDAVTRGAVTEDQSKGYALSTADPTLRAVQLKMRAYALRHAPLLRRVLALSSDARHRAAAAELFGYARQSPSQLSAFARAFRDRESEVRNNATRALIVLVRSRPSLGRKVPPEGFVEMMLSGTWTDLNKAGGLLDAMSVGRDPKLLARLRRPEVLERLVEMARWRTTHANSARAMLGRLAGINEDRLARLVAEGKGEEIIDALRTR